MDVKVDPELLRLSKSGKGTTESNNVYEFFLALAACNTIVPIVTETSDPTVRLIDYQGESPDEQALVYAAAAYGFMLIERTSGHIVIDVQGERQRYYSFSLLPRSSILVVAVFAHYIINCHYSSCKYFVKW